MVLQRIPYDGCPLCNSRDTSPELDADCSRHPAWKPPLSPVMTWMRCATCNHSYTAGYHSQEALDVIFSSTHAGQGVGDDLENQRYVWARVVEKIVPFANSGPWLDVGFGSGALLLTAQEFGFVPVGIDLRTSGVKALRALGVEAHAAGLDSFEPEIRFSVISMCDVLEHMPYPAEGLRRAHRLLEDNGVVLISMPNIDSAIWRSLDAQDANPYWPELEHYHNFSRSRLYRLLEETGFESLRYSVSERYRACMDVIARKKSVRSMRPEGARAGLGDP